MALTSDQVTRSTSPRFDFEVRLFVGPKREMVEFNNMAMGESWYPFYETTLAADVDENSTEIQVVDASAFTSGAVLIHPEGSGEAYEQVQYGSRSGTVLSDLTRVLGDTSDLSVLWGVHSAGATVSEFIEITDRVTQLTLRFDDSDGVAVWQVQFEGLNYSSFLLDNDNSVVAQIRLSPYNGDFSAWTPWTVWWIGYINKADIKGESTQAREWSGVIKGVSQYIEANDSPPKHYGKNDLARDKTVEVSSYLEDPYREWDSGEYVGFPSLDGDQVNDGEIATLWISEGEPSPVPNEMLASGMVINEVFLRPREGYSTRDHQWVELCVKRRDQPNPKELLSWWQICGKDTEFAFVGNGNWAPDTNFVPLKGPAPNVWEGDFIVLTFNKQMFLERYPSYGGSNLIIDLRPLIIGEFEIDHTGGFLTLKNLGIRSASEVWWSDGNPAWETSAPYPIGDHDQNSPHWEGPMIPTPPRGHSFRREPTGYAPDFTASYPWNVDRQSYWDMDEDHPTPGYHLTGEIEWLKVDLGEMGIALEEDLAADNLDVVTLNKDPLGLVAEGGIIRINQEVIGYSDRVNESNELRGLARGTLGSSPSFHPAGSVVEALPDAVSDATTNHLISSVGWRRRGVAIPGTSIPVVPMSFDVLISGFIDPITPDSDDWEEPEGKGGWVDYWEKIFTVRHWADTFWIGALSEPVRARHVMIVFWEMTDGGRVKLNQFHVWAEQVDIIEIPPEADEELEAHTDGAYSGAIIYDLITREIGLDPSLFTLEDPGRPFVELNTASTTTLALIKDICRRTGTSTVFHLDEHVTHRFHPLYPLAGLEEVTIEWTVDNARSINLTRPFRHNISQVVIRAREGEKEENFEAKYPPEPLEFGAKYELDDWVLTDPGDAYLMAEYTYRQRNAPLTAVVTPVGPAIWAEPGQRCVVTWDMDEMGEYLERRNFVVLGAQWTVTFGRDLPSSKEWRTTIRMKELIF